MAPPFVFPSNLLDLESPSDDRLFVSDPIESESLTPSDLEELVHGVSFDLSDREVLCVEDSDVFGRVYSLVKSFHLLHPRLKLNLLETLRSNLSVLLPAVDSLSRGDPDPPTVDRIASHRNAFRIYSFFLLTIALAEESRPEVTAPSKTRKKIAANTWNWELQRGRVLNLIANSMEIDFSLLFGCAGPDENYLSFVSKCVFAMFENPVLLRDGETRDAICRTIGTIAVKHRYTEQSLAPILHLVHKFSFTVAHLADMAAGSAEHHMDGRLVIALVTEIGRADPKAYVVDSSGAENVARFLVELAEKAPKLVAKNVGVLVPHFGGESYKIRNGLVGVLGKLVMKAFVGPLETDQRLSLRSKKSMLEILIERFRDVSAYTRSKTLQVWAELCEEKAVPIGLWNEVASLAVGRLEDKSSFVRKSALDLLITMLQHNPFGPQLPVSGFEVTLGKYREKLREMGGGDVEEAASGDGDVWEDNDAAEAPVDLPEVGDLEQTRVLVASLEAGLRFSRRLSEAMPVLVRLMGSSSSTDVEHAILLLMRCRQFQIDGSDEALRKMLPLSFSQDKSICEAVEEAFVTIYIRKNTMETAKNLLTLAIESNIGDLAAMESIVRSLVLKGEISASTIAALWDFFSFSINGVTAEQSRGALQILCMAAKSSTGILGSHLGDIIDIGFGRRSKEDPLLARQACIALEILSNEEREKLISGSGSRVFGILQKLITDIWLSDDFWYAFVDKAISAIYTVHPSPETLACNIIKRSFASVFANNDGANDAYADQDIGNTYLCSSVEASKLSKFLFIVGHVALKHLLYIESCVGKIRKERSKKEKLYSDSQDCQENHSLPAEANVKDDGISAELGLAASGDAMLDLLSERAEKEIVSGFSTEKNLISSCAPFLSKLCRNFSLMQKFPVLQASAMFALCKLMIIDADFCEANLQLLFTVVENAPSETVRSNCTVALADLAVRFPNLLEPWTENVYARLKDPSVSVQKNAVLVLSHLILNDMMKVKGYIYEMAMRLEDEDERTSNLAKLFFNELSKKGSNPIYNLLPDILSKLSNQNLKEESFCNIMQFLISSIKKDKQMEGLVEKLCNRFNGLTDVKQWEYLAYCLSQLTFTERGMKKLIEFSKSYEHALSEESVMNHFRNIISKGKKFAKPELKSCIEEFEDKLNKFHSEKREQELTTRNAEAHKLRVVQGTSMSHRENMDPNAAEGEVIDPYDEQTFAQTRKGRSKISSGEPEESHGSSSVVTEFEVGEMEVQSPITSQRVTSRSRAKKLNGTTTNGQMDSRPRRGKTRTDKGRLC
ncbi:hypothetical protein QJS04_geneDACA016585 [Acorus gramineus]|uniref:Condensin-1 complex subunit CAP-D2 n=1 Tax=Acorus gramineus TaxID=55184 RepID=A0AAV9BMZ0_ACOGR|nr:hypothetical protein QJS04_geneDACA016585 [Acorus gramineus]